MKREEAIGQLQICKDLIKQDGQDYLDERDVPILDMAIEALSADTVSREVYDKRTQTDEKIIDSYRQEFQKALSADAVQGEWKFVDHEVFAGEYFCSICGKRAEVDLYGEWILSNYCGHCGARMKEENNENSTL